MATIASVLNGMVPSARREALTQCCASTAWVAVMEGRAPFASEEAVLQLAAQAWRALELDDWREALAAHPRIGDVASLRAKYAATKSWAAGEQSGVDSASEATLAALAEGNARYEDRFGHLFIVCATGKTADEMLALLESRIDNNPDEELRIAAAEQLKITLLRLKKLAS